MRRAVIYLAWGEAYIAQAAASAATARAIGLPIHLITRPADVARGQATGAFDEVTEGPFTGASLLDKSHLYACVPAAFDTFLFLDTDTQVLGDVSLGFDMAEQYGIAMAVAPHYDITSYASFATYMTDKGIALRGQTQFNTGVIFAHRDDRAVRVFKTWRDICAEVAENTFRYIADDQPYFSIALHAAGVAPYTLAPTYNYRAAGEPALGPIRIWHNHAPPPPNVNDNAGQLPARAFRGAVRIA